MAVFPYAWLQLSPREISKVICILKPVINSGDIRLVLLSLKYQVVQFWTQNITVLLSAAPPLRKTSPFFIDRARTDLFWSFAVSSLIMQSLWNFVTIRAIKWRFPQFEWFRVSIQPLIENELYYFISFIFYVRRWRVPYWDRMTIEYFILIFFLSLIHSKC